MRRPVPRLALTLASIATLAGVAGCRGCKNDHPFVPYRIDEATPPPPVADAAPAVLDAPEARPVAHEPAIAAPLHATTWTLGGLALTAPAGSTFRQGLSWDIDGDGHPDALALVDAADEEAHEELVFYRGVADGAPSPVKVPLLATGSGTSLDPRCTRIEHLTRVGKRSAAIEVGETCAKGASSVAPDRTVALVAWSGSLRVRVAFTVLDPPDAPALAFDLDGGDVDGDGLDDASLRVSLEGGGAPFEPIPPVRMLFRWFDRPAGMSREPSEPERSLHAIASLAAQRAVRAKEAASAAATAAAGRFLFQAVCAESPGRRVAPAPSDSPLTCESGRALEDLGLAATHAFVTLGDPLRAIAALDDAEGPPAAHTPARVAEATAWITTLAPVVQATIVRAIGAVPLLGPKAASWGALRFEPSGNFLVRTPAGVVRVDPLQGDETDAAGVAPWPSKVLAPDGTARLEGAFAPCRGVALEAMLVLGEAGDASAVALPIASPVAPRCTSGDRDPVPAIPVAWGPGGLELIVAGEPVLVAPSGTTASTLFQGLGQAVTPGAPRSPDGSVLVVPTSQGIAVHAEKTRLLRAKELDHGYGELRDCAVSDDASRIACVRGGVAFVGVWPPP